MCERLVFVLQEFHLFLFKYLFSFVFSNYLEYIMFSVSCLYRYPIMKVRDIESLCPFCRKICNCNRCLHSSGVIEVCFCNIMLRIPQNYFFLISDMIYFFDLQTSKTNIGDSEKIRHLNYLICSLLPFLKQICEEQTEEVEIEASIQGINFSKFVKEL